MAKHYALWPSRYSDCTDPEKLNLMPFVDEDVTNLGEFAYRSRDTTDIASCRQPQIGI